MPPPPPSDQGTTDTTTPTPGPTGPIITGGGGGSGLLDSNSYVTTVTVTLLADFNYEYFYDSKAKIAESFASKIGIADLTSIRQISATTDNTTFTVKFTITNVETLTAGDSEQKVKDYFSNDQASLIAPVKTVTLDSYLGDQSLTIVSDGVVSATSQALSNVTEADYNSSLEGISIEVKTTVKMIPQKYYKWIFNTSEAISTLVKEQIQI